MFEFLKNIINIEEPSITHDVNSVHRILKTDIRREPNPQEDEIIFGCGCFSTFSFIYFSINFHLISSLELHYNKPNLERLDLR